MGRSPEVTLPPANGMNSMNDDDTSRWQELIERWFADHPETLVGPAQGISTIARRMAATDGRPDAWQDYKSMAHKVYHAYRGAGAELDVGRRP